MNRKMAAVACATRAAQQRGFLAGRRIEDCVFEVESASLAWSYATVRQACAVSFDFRTASPSLAHAWLWKVLCRLGVPFKVARAIQELRRDCRSALEFTGVSVAAIGIQSGVEQGCPLSATIFALAADPLLRALQAGQHRARQRSAVGRR